VVVEYFKGTNNAPGGWLLDGNVEKEKPPRLGGFVVIAFVDSILNCYCLSLKLINFCN
jgi:hypothetical protein